MRFSARLRQIERAFATPPGVLQRLLSFPDEYQESFIAGLSGAELDQLIAEVKAMPDEDFESESNGRQTEQEH